VDSKGRGAAGSHPTSLARTISSREKRKRERERERERERKRVFVGGCLVRRAGRRARVVLAEEFGRSEARRKRGDSETWKPRR
jgi:hypothetical protein